MKKKKICFSLLLICLIVGGIALFHFENSPPKIKTMTKTEPQQTNALRAEKEEEKNEKIIHQTSSQNSLDSNSKKVIEQRRSFSRKAIEQNYYVEQVDTQGKLNYVKATEEALNELQSKAKDNTLTSYQVLHNGQLIAVLSQ